MDHLSVAKPFQLENQTKIKIQPTLTQMIRISNNIYGYAFNQNLFLEIDTKHIGVYPFKLSDPLLGVKYLHNDLRAGYYLVTQNSLRFFDINEGQFLFGRQQFSGSSIKNKYDKQNKQNSYLYKFLTTNNKAEFTGVINGNCKYVIFSKYHKQHDKFSVNIVNLLEDQESNNNKKRILKLEDYPIQNMHITRLSQQIFYQSNNVIKIINVKYPQDQYVISKKGKFMAEQDRIYIFDASNTKLSTQIGIFDFKTNKCTQYLPFSNRKWHFQDNENEYRQNEQSTYNLKIPLLENKKKSTREARHNGISLRQKNKTELPNKIESLKNLIIIGFENQLQFWDLRKPVEPFCKQRLQNLSSFYYEPNLAKIYTSSADGLNVFNIK